MPVMLQAVIAGFAASMQGWMHRQEQEGRLALPAHNFLFLLFSVRGCSETSTPFKYRRESPAPQQNAGSPDIHAKFEC